MVKVALPTVVQVMPSGELFAVTVLPLRVSDSHWGAVTPAMAVSVDVPPVVVRRWKMTPLPGVTKILACIALAAVPSRSIKPAFAQTWVLVWLVTFAEIVPFPDSMAYV